MPASCQLDPFISPLPQWLLLCSHWDDAALQQHSSEFEQDLPFSLPVPFFPLAQLLVWHSETPSKLEPEKLPRAESRLPSQFSKPFLIAAAVCFSFPESSHSQRPTYIFFHVRIRCQMLRFFPIPDLDLWLEVAFWCQVLLLLQTLATPGPLLPAQLSTATLCFLGSQTCILMCFSITAFCWAVLELGSRLSGTTFPWVFQPLVPHVWEE